MNMLNRTIAPPIKDAVDLTLQLKPYEKFVLDNGVEVYSVNAGEEEVLQLEWIFSAGNWYDEQSMIAATTNYLLKNGTIKKTAFEINEQFEYYGAYVNRACYSETAAVTLHCLSKHLPLLLANIAALFTDANFAQQEIDIYKQNSLQRLQVNLKKADFVANRLIDEYLFSFHHPYGHYSTAPAIEAITREQIVSFYNQYYKNGRCIIFAAGKLPPNFYSLINEHFGKLPFNQKEIIKVNRVTKPAANIGAPIRISNDANGVQGAIRMARHFPNRHHPDFLKIQVLNCIFGGFFGSRLMSNIREEKGYTYGIHSYLQNHIQQSAWVVSTEAGRDVSEATVKEVLAEMELLRDELVDDEELLLVKNYLIGNMLGDLDGPFHIIGRWKNIILNGLDKEYFNRSVATIKNITAEELKALANKYLQPKDFYDLIVV
jgi:zinc protease